MSIYRRLFRSALFVWVIIAGIYSPTALSGEADLEAAFILNFVKYTSWPGSTLPDNSHLLLCYVGSDSPLSKAIEGLHGKRIETVVIEVRKTTRLFNLDACHVLVLGKEVDTEAFLKAISPFSLTIGEGEDFAKYGGGIGLYRVEDRMRFDVNLDATKEKNLKISASLLRLARTVQGKQ